MKDFHTGRWLLGGVVAGLVVWVLEGALSALYIEEMTARLGALGLSMEVSAAYLAASLAVTLLGGLVMIYFYVLAREALGPGPVTALVVAFALFCGGYLPSLIGYYLLGLFRTGLLLQWAVQGLVEMLIGAIVGALLYKPRANPGS